MKTIYFTKKKFKLVIIGLLFTSVTFSQTYIDNTTLTSKSLADIFERAFVEVTEIQDSYVKVKDVYASFVDLDPSKRYISISGNYAFKPNLNKTEILEFINKVNTEVVLVKAYYGESNNSINYIAYMWIEKGFTDASLIKMLKSYNLALDLVLQKDPDQKFLK